MAQEARIGRSSPSEPVRAGRNRGSRGRAGQDDGVTLNVDAYEVVETTCLRCGAPARMRFRGPCDACIAELDAKYTGEARAVEAAEYEPKMNVTPNAVALKGD
jgi:hypothetical protein